MPNKKKKAGKNGPTSGSSPNDQGLGLSDKLEVNLAKAKFLYGKVENTGVPEGYKPVPFHGREVSYAEDHPDAAVTYTTLPATFIGGTPDPQGHTEWIVLGNTKKKILATPRFPRSVPRPLSGKPLHVIREVPGMGLGVFATRDIRVGEVIFAERPFLIAPRNLSFVPASYKDHYTVHQCKQIQLFEWEATLKTAVDRMEDDAKEAFMQLANSHKEDGSGPIGGIFRTNAFALGGLVDGPVGTKITDYNGYAAIARDGSRINHSCLPNTRTIFDIPSFSIQFLATKNIKAGDELFYAYCIPLDPAATRQEALAPYGIVCACSACVNATPESELFRRTITELLASLKTEVEQWVAKPVPASFVTRVLGREAILARVLTFQKQMIEEGLDANDNYGTMLMILHKVYNHVGKIHRAARTFQDMLRYLAMARLENE